MKTMPKMLKKRKSKKIPAVVKILIPAAGIIAAKKLWDKNGTDVVEKVRSKVLGTTEEIQEKVQKFHDFVENSVDAPDVPDDTAESADIEENTDVAEDTEGSAGMQGGTEPEESTDTEGSASAEESADTEDSADAKPEDGMGTADLADAQGGAKPEEREAAEDPTCTHGNA